MARGLELSPDATLDLRGTPCPLNFIRAKLRLEQVPAGNLLELFLDAGEPIEQVPSSLMMEGYAIEELRQQDHYFVVWVRRPLES